MASTIFFNGRLISVPGSYSEVDASGLEVVGLGASGIVACIGTAKGGIPWTAIGEGDVKGDLEVATRPQQPFDFYREGDLREAGPMLFGPSQDPDVPGGAQEIVYVKANPAAQSSSTFTNSDGNAMAVTSRDYGFHTTQINMEIATGTSQGKLITIVFEDIEETFDDVGGDSIFDLQYSASVAADGYTTIKGEVTVTGGAADKLMCVFTRLQAGLDTDVTNQVTAGQVIEMVSSDAGDTDIVVEVYGTDTSDLAQWEQFATDPSDGTTAVDTTKTWNSFHGARIISGTAAGTITLRNDGAGLTITTLTAGAPTAALEPTVDHSVAESSIIKITMDGTTDFIAGDIGKTIRADGDDIGPLIAYSNDDPIADEGIAWVRDTNNHGAVADNQAITTSGGTGAGTANAASSVLAWLDYVLSAAGTERITVVGLNTSGVFQIETVQMSGTTALMGLLAWSRIDYLALGELPAATNLTIGGNAIKASFGGVNTVQKLADFVNGKAGFTLSIDVGNPGTYSTTRLDQKAETDIKDPAIPSFYADLYTIVNELNTKSELVTAERVAPGTGNPDNTTDPVFLTGGHEGSAVTPDVVTSTSTDWQGCLDLLTKVRVNSIVVMTGDPAIHAMVKAHSAYMGGVGRNERDGFVGLQNTAQDDVPTKAEAKSQIIDLGTKWIRACAQAIEFFGTDGTRQEFTTYFQACIAAGMQAGSPVGTPLTRKYANVLKLRQDSSWNPTDDAEELIQAGLFMMEQVDGVGRRVVRNVTTYLLDDNLAFTEGSVVEATSYAVYNFRTEMDRMTGQAGFAGSATAATGLAVNILGLLVGVALVAWRSLTVDLVLDVLTVECEMAPVLPINFVKNTVHLVTVPQSAAAAG